MIPKTLITITTQNRFNLSFKIFRYVYYLDPI